MAQYDLSPSASHGGMSVSRSANLPSLVAGLVSCLCVTRHRVAMLRRAVNCFLDQSYEPRELVVLFESDDVATRDFLATLHQPQIRPLEISVAPKQTLGALRNLSVRASRGEYIANWDDDDWHSPLRLASQMSALRSSGKSACTLARWLMFDTLTQHAYLSGKRFWEGSLVARRTAITNYPDVSRGEDRPVVDALIAEDQIVGLDSPHLYVYLVHGANTWDIDHWQRNLLPFAQRLTPESAAKVRAVLTDVS